MTLGAPPAQADEDIEEQAWTRVATLGTFIAEPGRIYVAASGGLEEARSFVQLRGGLVPADGAVRLKEADDTLSGTTPSLVACLLVGSLDRSGEVEPTEAPTADCRTQTRPTSDASGTWTVDLGVFREPWSVSTKRGIVLVPDLNEGIAGTFRLSFEASETTRVAGAARPGAGSDDASDSPSTEAAPLRSPPTLPDFSVRLPEISSPTVSEPTVEPGEEVDAPQVSRRVDVASGSVNGSANGPPAAVFFVLLGLITLATLGRRSVRDRVAVPSRLRRLDSAGVVGGGSLMVLALLPLAGSQLTVFRAGLVVIFLVAAIGLHMLVNWAGELSLAHAAMVGLPAFAVAGLSEVAGVSPLYLLPLGVAIGASVGLVVALPVLRTRGLQVALVTLVAGKAIERYFYSQEWLSPRAGRVASEVSLGPIALATPRSLYPVLVLIAAAAVAVAWALLHSKLARAWFWVRADPSAAASFGISVVRYRLLAYAVGGAFAGLGGALTVMWVQRLSPSAFPSTLSVTYLVVAVLAGPGFVGGVALAGGALEAGRLFGSGTGALIAYAGPVALVLTITRYEAGLNGIGRNVMRRLQARTTDRREAVDPSPVDEPIYPSFIIGVVGIVAGFVAIALGWYHAGNTNQVWIQNQEILSGGFGGLGLVLAGTGLLIRDRLIHTQRLLSRLGSVESQAEQSTSAPDSTEQVAAEHRDRPVRRRSRALTAR